MNSLAPEPATPTGDDFQDRESWSRLRWLVCVVLAFAIHIGLIFLFGSRKPVVPRAVVNAPAIQFTTGRSELQRLDDPTLFALPHRHGFAAAAWLPLPQVEFAPFRWTEPPQLLDLPVAMLGSVFLRFAQTNAAPKLELNSLPTGMTTHVELSEQQTSLKQHSGVSVNGRLAKRTWLNPPALLRSWPATDLLTNSIVRIVIDPDGQVFSPVLLPPGSGSKAADQYALEVARSARFAPVPRSAAKQLIGTLTFEWHTVPVPDTNAPPAKP